jgi:hypothetical protein
MIIRKSNQGIRITKIVGADLPLETEKTLRVLPVWLYCG